MSDYMIPHEQFQCPKCPASYVEIDGTSDEYGIGMYIECNACGHHWYYEESADE